MNVGGFNFLYSACVISSVLFSKIDRKPKPNPNFTGSELCLSLVKN